jgi:hypothetical protein
LVVVVVVSLGVVTFVVELLLVLVSELDCVAACPNAMLLIASESRSTAKVFMVVSLLENLHCWMLDGALVLPGATLLQQLVMARYQQSSSFSTPRGSSQPHF